MATTSPDNIKSPDAGDQYALVQDMGALADTVQSALVRRANLYKGTTAQRIAFTAATEGTWWQDTNGNKVVWVRKAGAWVQAVPPTKKIAAGARTGLNLPASTATSYTVQLPSGMFSTSPRVVVSSNAPVAWDPQPNVRVLTRSADSFVVQAYSSAARDTFAFDWVAVEE